MGQVWLFRNILTGFDQKFIGKRFGDVEGRSERRLETCDATKIPQVSL